MNQPVCLYIEGPIIEVSAEKAQDRVASGKWFECTSTGHNLDGKYDEADVRIFHRQEKTGGAA